MNICFFEWGYPAKNFGGGGGTYVQIITKELVRRGHKAFVISQYLDYEPEEYFDDGVLVRRIRIKGWHGYFTKIPLVGSWLGRFFRIIESSLAINKTINKIHNEQKLDLVEFPESANFLYSLEVNLPYLVHLHVSSFTCKKYCVEKITLEDRLQRKLEGFFMKKAGFLTSPSMFLKEEVIKEFKIDSSKIHVIPYPLDFDELNSIGESRKDEWRNVYYAGRIEKRKGVDILLKAVPLVIKSNPKVKFWLFGSSSNTLTLEEVKSFLKVNNVEENVKILSHIPREELINTVRDFDLCVFPAIFDNSPYVIYEAMALGKAVISTRSFGGIPELIEDGVTGLLVQPGNVEELANAIINLLRDEKKSQEMGELARKKAEEYYDVKIITDKRLALYNTIIEKHKIIN